VCCTVVASAKGQSLVRRILIDYGVCVTVCALETASGTRLGPRGSWNDDKEIHFIHTRAG